MDALGGNLLPTSLSLWIFILGRGCTRRDRTLQQDYA
jgi:hypothetical protein